MNHNIVSGIIAAIVIAFFLWVCPKPSGNPIAILLPQQTSLSSTSPDSVQVVSGSMPASRQSAALLRLEMMLPNTKADDQKSISAAMQKAKAAWQNKLKVMASGYGCSVVDIDTSMSGVDVTMSPPVLHIIAKCYRKTVSG